MSQEIQIEQKPATSLEVKRKSLFTRLSPSSLSRIAFWASFIGMLGGLGGTIALTITNGAPSRDIVVVTICTLTTTILLAIRNRLALLVSILLETYGLYLVFTEPFVIESLANPKGPNGGYGHFIGDVLVIAISIIAFVATIGVIAQDYRSGGRRTPYWFVSVLGSVLGLVIGASFIGAVAQPVSLAPQVTYTNGVPTVHLNPGGFDLSSVTITKGSKLLLVDDTTEQHVISNGTWQQSTPVQTREPGAPRISNLSLSGNSATIGPFTTAGTYHILCLLHKGMNLTIIVQ